MEDQLKNELIELLQCAEINCDNIKHLGTVAVMIVQTQINAALKLLGASSVTELIKKP